MKFTLGQIIGILILLAVIAAGAIFGVKQIREKKSGGTRQAVFLTNGQVYFGYTKNEGGSTVKLTDVYYLQVQDASKTAQNAQANDQQISLVKLGNELHGPEDEMRINRDQILFIEDMKSSSKVNEAIANFVKNGGQASPTPTP